MKFVCNIAIVEDDEAQAAQLKACLEQFAKDRQVYLQIAQFYDSHSFISAYKADFDVIFLDIRLPDGNGMNIAKYIRKHKEEAMIILVTNLANYAIKGYDVGAFDFILKPVNYENFAIKFKRAYAVIERNRDDVIKVKAGKDINVVPIAAITYIEVIDHNICVHTVNAKIDTIGKISDYYDRLAKYGFALCNQCYLVNLRHVAGVTGDMVLVGEDELRISRPRKKEFLKALNDYLGA